MIPACVRIRFRLACWCLFDLRCTRFRFSSFFHWGALPLVRVPLTIHTSFSLWLAPSPRPPSRPPALPTVSLSPALSHPELPPTPCPFSHSLLAVMRRSVSDSSRGRDNCAFTGCCRSKAADGNSSHTHERNFGSRAGKVSHAASAFNMCIILCSPQGWLLRVSWPGGGRVELWHAVVLGQRLHG